MENEIKKDGRGGRREGAGRKQGVKVGAYKGRSETLSKQEVFCVTEKTHDRVKQLRELTKQDTMPFNRMFEAWVAEMAKDYGID